MWQCAAISLHQFSTSDFFCDNKHRVHDIGLKPDQGEVDRDLGLAEALLVEDGRVGKILDCPYGVNLVGERLVLQHEFGRTP